MTGATAHARAAVTTIFVLNGFLFGSWAARIPAVKERLGVGEGGLGLVLAGIAIGALVAMPVAGWCSARAGSRSTTRIGLAAACVVVPVPSLCTSPVPAFAATLAFGVAMGFLDVSMNAHGVAVERRRGRPILSSFHAGFSGGTLLGALTGAAAAGAGLDVRLHLLLASLLSAAVGLVAAAHLLPASADVAAGDEPLFVRPPRRLWALGAIGFCCLLAEGSAGDWSAVYVDESLGASAATAALAFSCFAVAMTLGRLVGDRLTERFGEVRLVRGGGLLGGGGLLAALLIGAPAAAFAGFLCLGLGLAAMVPTVFRGAGSVPGLPPGVGLAAVSTLGYTGFLVGPPLIGALAEATSLPLALGFVCLCCAVVVVLAGAARPAAPLPAPPLVRV
ncbi:MAG TPA: MFS transporter [Solirubrobacteraceae bacterium]